MPALILAQRAVRIAIARRDLEAACFADSHDVISPENF
jgi:hypothetical protein